MPKRPPHVADSPVLASPEAQTIRLDGTLAFLRYKLLAGDPRGFRVVIPCSTSGSPPHDAPPKPADRDPDK